MGGAAADVRRTCGGGFALADRLAQRDQAYATGPVAAAEVRFADDASDTATVLEVRAARPAGAALPGGQAIADCGLDVRTARVGTLGAEAVDAFYLSSADGGW